MRALRLGWRAIRYLLALFVFLFLIQRSTYPVYLDWNAVTAIVREHQFDYVGWEVSALASKMAQSLWGVHPFLNETERSQIVRDYMADFAEVRRLEADIQAIFIDPQVADPEAETQSLRAERDRLRADLDDRQALAESILEGQVASVLVDEGFGVLGQLLPPISMRFTQMPNLLVVSPRDRIEFQVSLNLEPLPLEKITALEERIDQELDMSSLIVPLGGMALYPAMIHETSNISWVVETFAHEWVHHYFFFFPLGLSFDFAGEARIINETVADIFGREIGQLVLQRYYPELYQPIKDTPAAASSNSEAATDEVGFDYGAAMHETRVTVDKMLAAVRMIEAKSDKLNTRGHVQEAERYTELAEDFVDRAEDYMEVRRVLFFENGYPIRKLNQAYFAFYGGYQGGIAGIGGEDPIGPAVRDIRAMSSDLHTFVATMREITTREELLAVRDAMQPRT